MEPPTTTSEIFTLPFLLTIGITCVLVAATAVILYHKITRQSEKLDAVMELSAVLAQEVRAHDMMLKQCMGGRYSPNTTEDIGQTAHGPESGSSHLGHDGGNGRSGLVYVSDGPDGSDSDSDSDSGSDSGSDDNIELCEIGDVHRIAESRTLDAIIMNMASPFNSSIIHEAELLESSGEDSGDSGEDSDDSGDSGDSGDDDEEDEECDVSGKIELLDINISEEDLSNENISSINDIDETSVEKRVITLDNITICNDGDAPIVEELVDAGGEDTHKILVDLGDHSVDYKKLNANELKRIAVDRGVMDKGDKKKKSELVELLSSS